MAYLAKARKDDLKTLATELGLQVNDTMRVIDLKDLIVKSETYDEIFTKNLLETLIETRQQQENDHKNLEERKRKEQDLLFEIKRLKLNLAAVGSSPNLGASASNQRQETLPPLACYGCGKSGFIRAKCPDCNPSKTSNSSNHSSTFGTIQIRSCLSSTRNAVFRISLGGVYGTAFADSGASHSIASESLYHILQQQAIDGPKHGPSEPEKSAMQPSGYVCDLRVNSELSVRFRAVGSWSRVTAVPVQRSSLSHFDFVGNNYHSGTLSPCVPFYRTSNRSRSGFFGEFYHSGDLSANVPFYNISSKPHSESVKQRFSSQQQVCPTTFTTLLTKDSNSSSFLLLALSSILIGFTSIEIFEASYFRLSQGRFHNHKVHQPRGKLGIFVSYCID
ncbi:unnamed protein product [Larinioides sclopetarius]|uniref:Uncharacterized protein n=1 Tax=Larinioides sclopetarius TaxID=280406 RepID=A0AAV2A4S5_9ARAC